MQYRAGAGEQGSRVVQVLASDLRDGHNRIYTTLLAAIDHAEHEVRISRVAEPLL